MSLAGDVSGEGQRWSGIVCCKLAFTGRERPFHSLLLFDSRAVYLRNSWIDFSRWAIELAIRTDFGRTFAAHVFFVVEMNRYNDAVDFGGLGKGAIAVSKQG